MPIQLPPSGTVTLNGGAATTFSRVVTLDSSSVANAIEMRTSTDGVNWTSWRPFEADTLVGLPGLPGAKTVYAQYRNASPTVFQTSGSVKSPPSSSPPATITAWP